MLNKQRAFERVQSDWNNEEDNHSLNASAAKQKEADIQSAKKAAGWQSINNNDYDSPKRVLSSGIIRVPYMN